jgi:hypothetical protein
MGNAPAPRPRTIEYRRPPSPPTARQRELEAYARDLQPVRDWIVPIILVVIGLALYVRWYVTRYHLGLAGAGVVSSAFVLLVAFETAILLVLAYGGAWIFDITFGRLDTAALKFAGIVAISEGVGIYLRMRVGYNSTSPRGVMGVDSRPSIVLGFLVLLVLLPWFFNLKFSDARGFVAMVAILYTLAHLILVMNLSRLVIHVRGVPITIVGAPAATPPRTTRVRPPPTVAPPSLIPSPTTTTAPSGASPNPSG